MRLFLATLGLAALAAVHAQDVRYHFLIIGAGSFLKVTTTILAACGTSCPTGPAPDVSVARIDEPVSEGTPCPSLIASGMIGGNMTNGTMPTATNLVPSMSSFTGAGAHATAGIGAAAGFILALLAL